MNRLLGWTVTIIAILVVAVLLAPTLIPASLYKDRVAEIASERTGRDISLGDEVSLSLFPTFKVKLSDVVIGNAEGGKSEYFAKAEKVDVQLPFGALFEGVARVERFVLINPEINLEENASGGGNWEFSGSPDEAQESAPQDETEQHETGSHPSSGATLSDVQLGDVRLENGTVRLFRADGTKDVYENVSVKVELENVNAPFSVDGSLKYNGEPVKLNARVDRLSALADGSPTNALIDLDSSLGKIKFDGTLEGLNNASTAIGGKINVDIPSIRKFAAFMGNPIGGSGGFGALRVKSSLKATGDRASLPDLDIFFDGMQGNGRMDLNMTTKVPTVTGKLAVDKLDFNKFMGETASAPSRTSSPAAGSSGSSSGGSAAPSGGQWSSDPIDFSALKSFNADLDLTTDQLFFQDIKIGKSIVDIDIINGVLTARLKEMALYEGGGQGELTLNTNQATPTLVSNFTIDAIKMLPFLRDSSKFDKLEGIGRVTYSLRSTGNSQAQLIGNLSGTGDLLVRDGAWSGVDLAAMAKTLDKIAPSLGLGQNKGAGQGDVGASKKTYFTEFAGNFQVKQGVVSNDNLKLIGPLVRITGGGTVDLPRQYVRYRINPKVTANTGGQGGDFKVSGVTIPVIIEGPLNNIKYAPDFAGLIGGALSSKPGEGEAADPLQNIIRDTLGGVLGTNEEENAPAEEPAEQPQDSRQEAASGQEQQPEPEKEPEPEEIIRDIFGGILQQQQQQNQTQE